MMKIVIDISEDVFTRLFDCGVDPSPEDIEEMAVAIRNGTIIFEDSEPADRYKPNINLSNNCSICPLKSLEKDGN